MTSQVHEINESPLQRFISPMQTITENEKSPQTTFRPISSSSKHNSCRCAEEFQREIGYDPSKALPLYHDVEKQLAKKNRLYHFFRYSLQAMLFLQILLGAAVATLGAQKGHGVSITVTVFGAIQTVVASLVSLLKAANQPNQARYMRDELRDLKRDLDLEARAFLANVDGEHSCSQAAMEESEHFVRRLEAMRSFDLNNVMSGQQQIDYNSQRRGGRTSRRLRSRSESLVTSLKGK